MGERFPHAEFQIRDELTRFIDDRIEKYGWDRGAGFCSSWIPGPEWGEGSGVYLPIYLTMLDLFVDPGLAHQRAGWLFGLILMDLMIRRNDEWVFWRESTEPGDDPDGLYYKPNVQTAA